jgi:hypothetical protein
MLNLVLKEFTLANQQQSVFWAAHFPSCDLWVFLAKDHHSCVFCPLRNHTLVVLLLYHKHITGQKTAKLHGHNTFFGFSWMCGQFPEHGMLTHQDVVQAASFCCQGRDIA